MIPCKGKGVKIMPPELYPAEVYILRDGIKLSEDRKFNIHFPIPLEPGTGPVKVEVPNTSCLTFTSPIPILMSTGERRGPTLDTLGESSRSVQSAASAINWPLPPRPFQLLPLLSSTRVLPVYICLE